MKNNDFLVCIIFFYYICKGVFLKHFTMVNIEEFIKRLESILDYYNLTASSFADKIGVQRSSLSHLLSGRNNPSLDFILKIVAIYPEVDLYWLLNGKGQFPLISDLKNDLNSNLPPIQPIENKLEIKNLFSEAPKPLPESINEPKIEDLSSEIDKIVFFYKNGTFQVYKN